MKKTTRRSKTMTISLAGRQLDFVDEKVRTERWLSRSDFIRTLIDDAQRRDEEEQRALLEQDARHERRVAIVQRG